ncbi:MAG: ABC transporter ATP-binding protein [Candidatus Bathyarchaeota archaeon]|nr:ABC transporter ATP-binding protein [Candidatus Bathyarchaeota archaeon]
MSKLLKVQDVYAGYGKLIVVQGVSLTVEKNEIVVIVGPNGSGKSTLIKSIVGFSKIFDGKIFFDGFEITGIKADAAVRMGIGYVPQINNVFTNLTVEENIEVGGYIQKDRSKAKMNVKEIFEMFPILKPHRREKASTLSGGERQILALARVMVLKPKLILLDEPTASLSPKTANQVLSYIKDICVQGTPVVMAEQNARKSLMIADRGCVLVDGKCVKEGLSKEILEDKEIGKLYLGIKTETF